MTERSDNSTNLGGELGSLLQNKPTWKSIIIMSFINSDEEIEQFKDIKIVDKIGEGGEGIVYRSNILDGYV